MNKLVSKKPGAVHALKGSSYHLGIGNKIFFIIFLSLVLLVGTVTPLLAIPSDGTVKSFQKISQTQGGFSGTLGASDFFGRDVENIGDLDGDGVNDLAVGALNDDDGGTDRGAVYILFMNPNGTVKSEQKISDTAGGFTGTLVFQDFFGSSVANLGDLDGAGPSVLALAVGAFGDGPGAGGGFGSGAVYILFLNSAGIVQSHFKIANGVTNFGSPLGAGDGFGIAVANMGDIDGDGVNDLAVGADLDDDGFFDAGAVYIVFLNSNGTVKSVQKLSSTQGGATGLFRQQDQTGRSVANMGDLDGAGPSVVALAVGAVDGEGPDPPAFPNRGAVHILFLNSNGIVIQSQKISNVDGGFGGTIQNGDGFAIVENIGDLDEDGVNDLAVGALGDDDGGADRGAVWIVFLNSDGTVKSEQKISDTAGNFNGVLDNQDSFGTNIANMGDLDGDGVTDLAVGAQGDDDGGLNKGAVWILFMGPGVVKEITSGPDVDVDENIDVVVEVGQLSTTEYDFDITYTNSGGPDVLIVDTVPAEWQVLEVATLDVSFIGNGPANGTTVPDGSGGSIDVFKTGRGAKSKSSTKILWTPIPNGQVSINVVAETRQSPGKKNVKFAPTSCGPLFLNSGPAQVFEVDEDGEPLRDPDTGEKLPPLFESNVLCLAAVKDLDAVAGVVPDGSGDEDEDGLTDFEEACFVGTDPCEFDTDGDTVEDGADNCPLVANPNQTDGDEDEVGNVCDLCLLTALVDVGDVDANGCAPGDTVDGPGSD